MEQINVTKTYLPPIEEYTSYLNEIWKRGHLTNNGPLLQELEEKLRQFLGVKHILIVNNGTIALQIAIKALGLTGEIITTPFSYVATTSAVAWENCKPIFADIDRKTLCINPAEIVSKITSATSAILATHVYGNPCDVEQIQSIASSNNLKIIYDAAHAFGVRYKESSILNSGDISTLSFHATKLFHTIEGGAIVTNDDDLAYKIAYMRNFGHNGPEAFDGVGINGKTSEVNAAMGLCVLPKVPELIQSRKKLSDLYDTLLAGSELARPVIASNTAYNYSYYPVLFKSENELTQKRDQLNLAAIYPRRYFYPSLNTLNYVGEQDTPISEETAKKVLCLPLYHSLTEDNIRRIASIILS